MCVVPWWYLSSGTNWHKLYHENTIRESTGFKASNWTCWATCSGRGDSERTFTHKGNLPFWNHIQTKALVVSETGLVSNKKDKRVSMPRLTQESICQGQHHLHSHLHISASGNKQPCKGLSWRHLFTHGVSQYKPCWRCLMMPFYLQKGHTETC